MPLKEHLPYNLMENLLPQKKFLVPGPPLGLNGVSLYIYENDIFAEINTAAQGLPLSVSLFLVAIWSN